MTRILRILFGLLFTAVLTLVILASPRVLAAERQVTPIVTTVTALVSDPRGLDGKTVMIEGEAIGSAFPRRDGTWVNIGDQGVTLGVWLPRGIDASISTFGSWKYTGDSFKITGVFRVASPLQQGETYLEAQSLTLLKRGVPRQHPVRSGRLVLAGLLVLASVVAVRAAAAKHGWPARSI